MMKASMDSVAVAILSGGMSSRMGKPKTDLLVKKSGVNLTFLECLCQEFSAFSHKYISVSAEQKIQVPDFVSVVDIFEKIGPIGGIYSVLKAADTEAVFVIACDMPIFSLECAKSMLKKWNKKTPCFARVNGHREPLVAIYTKNSIPLLEKLISEKKYKLGIFHEQMKSQVIDMSEFEFDFTNINTMDDYRKMKEKM